MVNIQVDREEVNYELMHLISKWSIGMHIGFYNYYETYNKNRMFEDENAPIGDNLLYPFVYLKEYLISRGHTVSTIDLEDIDNFDSITFIDFPKHDNQFFQQIVDKNFKNLYLLIFESEVVRSDNWNEKNHLFFTKIFTWNDEWVDKEKYIKYYWPNKIPESVVFNISNKKKLCTMIAGHKFINHNLELYSERVKTIRWFEKNHPEDFDLYGIGWGEHRFKGELSVMNRLVILLKVIQKLERFKYKSYRGPVDSKKETLGKYKFAICYENARDIPGYITEKIFDCFFAGCVPVYWGAPNVTSFIPEDTFINRTKFNNHEELYDYLKNMPDDEYVRYLNAIKNFVEGEKIHPFSAECFADTIIREIIKNDQFK
jgi:hypothetical protein